MKSSSCVLVVCLFLFVFSAADPVSAGSSSYPKQVSTSSKQMRTLPTKQTVKKVKPVAVSLDRPDLQPNSITFSPGKPGVGETVKVWVKVWNTGKIDSTPATVRLVMRASYPPSGSNPPVYTATAPLAAITPNMAQVATFNIPLVNAIPGHWKAESTVDLGNQVPETNEMNNSLVQGFQIR